MDLVSFAELVQGNQLVDRHSLACEPRGDDGQCQADQKQRKPQADQERGGAAGVDSEEAQRADERDERDQDQREGEVDKGACGSIVSRRAS